MQELGAAGQRRIHHPHQGSPVFSTVASAMASTRSMPASSTRSGAQYSPLPATPLTFLCFSAQYAASQPSTGLPSRPTAWSFKFISHPPHPRTPRHGHPPPSAPWRSRSRPTPPEPSHPDLRSPRISAPQRSTLLRIATMSRAKAAHSRVSKEHMAMRMGPPLAVLHPRHD